MPSVACLHSDVSMAGKVDVAPRRLAALIITDKDELFHALNIYKPTKKTLCVRHTPRNTHKRAQICKKYQKNWDVFVGILQFPTIRLNTYRMCFWPLTAGGPFHSMCLPRLCQLSTSAQKVMTSLEESFSISKRKNSIFLCNHLCLEFMQPRRVLLSVVSTVLLRGNLENTSALLKRPEK